MNTFKYNKNESLISKISMFSNLSGFYVNSTPLWLAKTLSRVIETVNTETYLNSSIVCHTSVSHIMFYTRPVKKKQNSDSQINSFYSNFLLNASQFAEIFNCFCFEIIALWFSVKKFEFNDKNSIVSVMFKDSWFFAIVRFLRNWSKYSFYCKILKVINTLGRSMMLLLKIKSNCHFMHPYWKMGLRGFSNTE